MVFGARIDQLWSSEAVEAARFVEVPGSDHRGIVREME